MQKESYLENKGSATSKEVRIVVNSYPDEQKTLADILSKVIDMFDGRRISFR